MQNNIIIDIKKKMTKIIEFLKKKNSKLRTGKVNINLIEYISFNYFNYQTYLKQVSSISIVDHHSLLVNIWDKSLISIIKKAILDANLGITPIDYGDNLLIKFPPMTEESRLHIVKILKKDIELAKIAIRGIRMEYIKILKIDKHMSKDTLKSLITKIDNISHDFIRQIDIIYSTKKEEIIRI